MQDGLSRPRMIKVGRANLALGLVWLTATNPSSVSREAKIEAAKPENQADLFVARIITGNYAQFGLARRSSGLKAGAMAAAVALADTVRGSFVGAFPVDGGWWFVAVRDELLLPDGDAWYATEADARDRFRAALAEGGWQRIIAPRAWAGDAEELGLDQVLPTVLRAPRLTEVNPLQGRARYIGAAILILAMVGGGVIWLRQHSAQLAQDRARAEMLAKLAQQAAERPKIRAPETWTQAPMPSAVIDACLASLREMSPVVPGWSLTGIDCAAGQTTWSFARIQDLGSTVAWFAHWVETNPETATTIARDGNSASASRLQASPKPRGKQPLVDREQAIIRRMMALAQATGAELTLGNLRPINPPENVPPEDWEAPSFAPMSYSVRVTHPGLWREHLDAVPGLVVEQISFVPETGSYTLQGDIYARL